MRCSNMGYSCWGKKEILAGLGADESEGLTAASFEYYLMLKYEAVFWACRSWKVPCCRMLATSFQGCAFVAVSHLGA